MQTFSFSRLNLYESCPRRFYYKYILKWEDVAGLPATFGKTVHKAIELILNGRSFNEAILTAWIDEAEMDLAVEKEEVERHVNNALRLKFSGEVERHFVMELAKGVKFQGFIDLTMLGSRKFPRPAIVDWKTGRNVFEVLDTRQTTMYAAHVMEKYNQPDCLAMLFYTRFSSLKKAIITAEMAEEAKEWVVTLAKEIQGKLEFLPMLSKKEIIHFAFPARTGGSCSHCPWGKECLMDDKK